VLCGNGWSGFLRVLFILGALWVGGLLWLHVVHAEINAEVEIVNRMFHAVGGEGGKLAHLKDFATSYIPQMFAEKIMHIDSYDPADKHDDAADSLQSMLAQTGTVDDDASNGTSGETPPAEGTAAAATAAATAAAAGAGEGAGSADDDTALDDDNVVRSSQRAGEEQGVLSEAKATAEQSARDEAIHILFSTDCSVFQDWQALVLFHSAHRVGQRGHITRLASGCGAKAQFELITLYARLWPSSRTGGWVYSVHFPPDFQAEAVLHSKAHKPHGVQHWLRRYAQPEVVTSSVHSRGAGAARLLVGNDTIVALIEPDFLFLRPLTVQVRDSASSLFPPQDSVARAQAVVAPRYVRKGQPVGQLIHGLGAPWAVLESRRQSKKSLRSSNSNSNGGGGADLFDVEHICGKDSACNSISVEEALRAHAVGPPYLVHIDDFRKIVDSWVQMVPKIQSDSGLPNDIAVMHAYNLAAAHLEIPHVTVLNLMIAHVDYSDAEGWKWIDDLGDDVCQPPVEALHTDKKTFYPKNALPTLLHYHHYYEVGEFGFYKHLFDTKYFQCNSPLLVEPPLEVGKLRVIYKHKKAVKVTATNARRNGFMLCALSRVINDAVLDVKIRSCHAGGDSEGNIRDVHDVRAEDVKDTYDVVNRDKSMNLVMQ